jgi:hypothetical protein
MWVSKIHGLIIVIHAPIILHWIFNHKKPTCDYCLINKLNLFDIAQLLLTISFWSVISITLSLEHHNISHFVIKIVI